MKSALRLLKAPGVNVVWADKGGNYGIQEAGYLSLCGLPRATASCPCLHGRECMTGEGSCRLTSCLPRRIPRAGLPWPRMAAPVQKSIRIW